MRRTEFAKQPESFFLRVKCNGCGNEQTVFSCASKLVKCFGCNQVLAKSGPGKIALRSKQLRSF